MGHRSDPTGRQRRLGAELRKMRERAGLNALEAGQLLGVNRTRISNMEAGRLGATEDRIRELADIYSCVDKAYIDALVAMAQERVKGWWDEYTGKLGPGLIDLAELEHHAVAMRSVHLTQLPGLLQTEEYAKSLFSAALPEPSSVRLRTLLSFRMKRRDVLDRDHPPQCTFLIHEAALRMQYGDPKVTHRQLAHLLEESERHNVTVRVIPFSAGGFPNASSSTTLYAAGPVPQLDTVQLDVVNSVLMLDSETELANYCAVLTRVEGMSLSPTETREFMLGIERRL